MKHASSISMPVPDQQNRWALTPYDILKCAALFLMLCDHIGAYLFPDDITWRLVGRFCVPIWLFLIGYARSRRIDAALISAALFISMLHYTLSSGFYNLNILWTIIFLRIGLNPLMRRIGHSQDRLILVTFLLFPFALLTRSLFEYGTMAWILGIWGYLVRNGFADENGHDRPLIAPLYGMMALVMFVITESIAFNLQETLIPIFVMGLIPVYLGLGFYLPRYNTRPVSALPPIAPPLKGLPRGIGITPIATATLVLRRFIRFISRHTLGFYVLHLTILLLLYARLCPCSTSCCCIPFGIDPTAYLH